MKHDFVLSSKTTEILDALLTRNDMIGPQQRAEEHLDMVYEFYVSYHGDKYDVAAGRQAVAEEKERFRKGQEYFDQGYRLHSNPRQIRGLVHTYPADAVEWGVLPSGYIATTEATRLWYVTAPKHQTEGAS